jgi:hypothetical protein
MSRNNDSKNASAIRLIQPSQMMLRRIIKKDGTFLCGICRSTHLSQNQAMGCLTSCWKQLLERAPWVVEVRAIGKHPYVCAYCQRGYFKPEQAHACAQDCINRENNHAATEGLSVQRKVTRSFHKSSAKSIVRMAFQNMIARKKLAEAQIEEKRIAAEQPPPPKEVPEAPTISNEQEKPQEFSCENCKSVFASEEKAAECLASHQT